MPADAALYKVAIRIASETNRHNLSSYRKNLQYLLMVQFTLNKSLKIFDRDTINRKSHWPFDK